MQYAALSHCLIKMTNQITSLGVFCLDLDDDLRPSQQLFSHFWAFSWLEPVEVPVLSTLNKMSFLRTQYCITIGIQIVTLTSKLKHMRWVLKRIISMRSFEHPKHISTGG